MKKIFTIGILMLLAVLLFPIFKLNTILIFLSFIVIDFDGVIYYMLNEKKFNIITVLKSNEYKYQPFRLAHTIEFFVLIGLLNTFNYKLLPLTIGASIHYLLDILFRNCKSIHGWFLIPFLFKNILKGIFKN